MTEEKIVIGLPKFISNYSIETIVVSKVDSGWEITDGYLLRTDVRAQMAIVGSENAALLYTLCQERKDDPAFLDMQKRAAAIISSVIEAGAGNALQSVSVRNSEKNTAFLRFCDFFDVDVNNQITGGIIIGSASNVSLWGNVTNTFLSNEELTVTYYKEGDSYSFTARPTRDSYNLMEIICTKTPDEVRFFLNSGGAVLTSSNGDEPVVDIFVEALNSVSFVMSDLTLSDLFKMAYQLRLGLDKNAPNVAM